MFRRWGVRENPITNYQCPMPHPQFLTTLVMRETLGIFFIYFIYIRVNTDVYRN